MENAVIVSAVRTPIGRFGGGLASMRAVELGAVVISEALRRAGVEPGQVEEVILGNVIFAGQGMNPARQASVAAGLPVEVPAMTVNKVCGSGLKSVALAAQAIRLGDAEVIVAGGIESMSQAPYLLPKARWGYRMGNEQVVDSMINDGLFDCMIDCHMGVTAEELASKYGLTREDVDLYALESQSRTKKAVESGRFKEEIVPVRVPQAKGEAVVVSSDEHPRPNVTMEQLAKLGPAFQKVGVVTAGNSAGINDGASAVVVMGESRASRMGLEPMAVIRSYASAALEPRMMGIAPAGASKRALEKAGLSIQDMDLVEINEAFASQVLAAGRELDLDWSRTNVNGGAISLGHPIGASGARILTTLLYEMEKRGSKHGLATLCIGGGQGIAMVVEGA
ncbi:MAG: acetyl-CoA C-acetyltransferase [SAR202 cluster bacterium]|nr:acetyl-CoA C-acetyltransferase [SAR202 cluster bacterium]